MEKTKAIAHADSVAGWLRLLPDWGGGIRYYFHWFIYGIGFTLQTDQWLVLSIFSSEKGIPIHMTNKRQRWSTILLNYEFKVEFLLSKRLWHTDKFI